MIMRFDPFRELDRLTDQMTAATTQTARGFPLDAYRRGDRFLVDLDLPGLDPDSIELTVERNVLTIRAERRPERQEGDEVLVAERPQGTFARQLFLGESLDADAIEANYDRGVLTLTIPVAEQAKPRKVQVSGGQEQPRTIEAGKS